MKKSIVLYVSLIIGMICYGQDRSAGIFPQTEQDGARMVPAMTQMWEPEVEVVRPAQNLGDAPSDAIILFDGSDIHAEWVAEDGSPTEWIVEDGAIISVRRAGFIKTKRVFEDFQLHIEWRTPSEVRGEGQNRGNSGVFLQELYEVQVLDNYNNSTYVNGQAGSIYKQYPPLVNVCRPPGEWQVYDIIYTAPRFNENGTYFTPPRVTVLQNGVLIQNNVNLRGPTVDAGIPEFEIEVHGAKSLSLQDHGSPVAYRNIWIREL